MLFGKVTGTIWASRKDERLEGATLLVVERWVLSPSGCVGSQDYLVAVDTVQAGEGDYVLIAQGSSARQTEQTRDRAVDAVIMAVVDNFDFASENTER